MALLLTLLGLALLAAALHPFLTYPVSLFLVRGDGARAPSAPPVPAGRPSIAWCMSCYNEEKVIVDKIETMLAIAERYGPVTIHVYDDGSSDRTIELLQPYAHRIDLVDSKARLGKTAGMNTLVARSSSELLAFTDTNVIIPPHGLIGLAEPFADPTVGCTSATLSYSNDDETATAQSGSIYWRVEEALKKVESETVGMIGVDGAFFMMRRALYEPAPATLIDDLYVSLCALMRGARVVTVADVVVHERSATNWREEMRRKRRIACQAMNVHRALWPRLRRMRPLTLYAYLSHRLLKWLSPFTLALAALTLSAALALWIGALLVIALWLLGAALLAVGAMLRVPPVPMALSSAASLYGVASGVIQSLVSRQTYTTWQPADSVRETT